jgi:AcrR family transcriptional regulator
MEGAARPAAVAADREPARPLRLPAAERRAAILAAAEAAFADAGFALTTRELAARLGVTQALLYKYFRSKKELIGEVLQRRLQGRDLAPVLEHLRAPDMVLEQRLAAFYAAYVGDITPERFRLFVRANLDGQALAARFGPGLTERVLQPVLGELRAAAGLPGLEAKAMTRGERELVMALHGAIVFLAVRKHIYRMPMPEALDELVALQVRAYLPGALAELMRLHAPDVAPSLAVEQLRRRP